MNIHDVAVALVREAGEKLQQALTGELSISHKENMRDPVTNVDIAINDFLTARLLEAFPTHRVYSEEDTAHTAQMKGYEWVLDPIDGTSNFSHRIPHFAICATLLNDGAPVLGVIYNPITNELFSFDREKGALLNGVPVRVSKIEEPKEAHALLLVGHKEPLWPWGTATYIDFLGNLNKTKSFGSTNLDLAFLAAGRVDVVVYGTFSMPDGASGVGMLRAAGGEVYDLKTGHPLTMDTARHTVVAVGQKALWEKLQPFLHKELLP